jgi:hypothetical protein
MGWHFHDNTGLSIMHFIYRALVLRQEKKSMHTIQRAAKLTALFTRIQHESDTNYNYNCLFNQKAPQGQIKLRVICTGF